MFIVDSNFFIQAHRSIYPLDVVPSFWLKVIELACTNRIVSIDKVKDEIYQNDDDLKFWCETNLPDGFFHPTDTVLAEYSNVVNWAQSLASHYTTAAIAEFLSANEADAWLVAFSLNKGVPLITYEKPAPNIKRKIKIPEVCNAFGSQYYNTIEMFRQLGETF